MAGQLKISCVMEKGKGWYLPKAPGVSRVVSPAGAKCDVVCLIALFVKCPAKSCPQHHCPSTKSTTPSRFRDQGHHSRHFASARTQYMADLRGLALSKNERVFVQILVLFWTLPRLWKRIAAARRRSRLRRQREALQRALHERVEGRRG